MADSLGAKLIHAQLVTRDELNAAITRSAEHGGGLVEALVAGGLDEGALLEHFAREGFVALEDGALEVSPDPELLARIPRAMAEAFVALPLIEGTTGAVVVMADPSDQHAREALAMRLGCELLPRAAKLSALRPAIERAFAARPAAIAPPTPASAGGGRRLVGPKLVPFALPEPTDHDSRWDEPARPAGGQQALLAPRPSAAPGRRARLAPKRPELDALAAPGDIGAYLAALRNAEGRDEILRTACESILPVCAGAVFLGRRRDVLVGHECAGRFISRDAVRSLFLPLSVPSTLRQVCESQRPYSGVYSASDADRLFRASIGSRSLQIAVEPVFVGARLTGLLCADDPRYGAAGAERMSMVAHAAGAALARLIREQRTRG